MRATSSRTKVRLHDLPLLARLQRELGEQGDVVAREVEVWKAGHLLQVVEIDVAQEAGAAQVGRVPDVLDAAGEAGRVVGELEILGVAGAAVAVVRRAELEGVRDAVARQAAVAPAREVRVIGRHEALRQELVHARVLGRVEVAADHQRDLHAAGVRLRRPRLGRRHLRRRRAVQIAVLFRVPKGGLVGAGRHVRPLLGELGRLVHEDGGLHELDVDEFGVPVDVRVSDNHACPSHAIFKERQDRDVVPRHHAIEDVVLALHVRSVDGRVAKVDQLLVQADELLALVEDGASVDQLGLPFGHGACSRLGPEHALVTAEGQLAPEEIMEVLLVDFLQAHHVGIEDPYLV